MRSLFFVFALIAACDGRAQNAPEDYTMALFELYSLVPTGLDFDVDMLLAEPNTRTRRAISYNFIDVMFSHTDDDGDNLISVDEFNNMFKHFDDDDDDSISAQEYVRGFKKRGYGSPHMGRMLFHAGDLNKNGRIETDDLATVRLRFDINGDHIVTKQEYTQKWQMILRAVQMFG
ncbi:unnamed protein product [Owenia fusiformis]|uniref:Uncharacterized protein n=1 Tax=Owenia fusiformis TaxID=6347 RepID=A0A8J1UXG9_OWEFU|nr:unnamed protein product [Owenia fusiformis]